MNVKRVIINGEETNYFLFDNGDLYNYKTHYLTQGTVCHGYIRYNLTVNGKSIAIFKHRLLAELFLENDDPENKQVVHHINGRPQDNSLENLEWVSQKENCQKKINPIEHKKIQELTEEELSKEVWVPFRETDYEISNMGRKRKKSSRGKVTFGSQNKNNGYIRWTFRDGNGKTFELQAHRAVYEAFHPDEEILVINHIDANRANNRLSNLENISQSENMVKAYTQTMTKKSRIAGQFDENGKMINVFTSASAAARYMGVASHSILQAMDKGGRICGYYWKEITKDEFNMFNNYNSET